MIEEELPDELENDLDDIEPVGDESQLYEHFRVCLRFCKEKSSASRYAKMDSAISAG